MIRILTAPLLNVKLLNTNVHVDTTVADCFVPVASSAMKD
jgi:hypothetical protein